MKKGRFIVLEGGEGVGKTAQRELLKQSLPMLFPDRQFIFTREPGGSLFADVIRGIILSEEAKHADGLTNFGLFLASRADHAAQTIRPALESGKIVVCDRYFASTYAYQIVAQERPELEEIFLAHTKLVPKPDLTLWLDMDPAEALARINKRTTNNYIDAKDLSFHKRIRTGFEKFFGMLDGAVMRIDAAPSQEQVSKELQKAIVSIL